MVRSKPMTLRKTPEVLEALEQIWTEHPFLRGKYSATMKQALFAFAGRGSKAEGVATRSPEPEVVEEYFSDNDNF